MDVRTSMLRLSALGLLMAAACDDRTDPLSFDPVKLGSVTFAPGTHMVTAAIAHVECSGPIAALQISYAASGVDSAGTPRFSVSACPADIDLLGLLPSTAYVTRISVWGKGADSQSVDGPILVTAPLPSDLPLVTTQVIESPAPGLTAFAVFPPSQTPSYVLIVDSTGRIRWYLADSSRFLVDLEPQPNGHYTLSATRTFGLTEFDELGVAGNVLRAWTALGGYYTDLHEFRFPPSGGGLLLGSDFRTMDLSAYGGSSAAQVTGGVLEQLDSVGRVLFFWNSFDHLSITDIDPSISLASSIVDWTHCNAIGIDQDSNYLVSSRNLSEITKIDSRTGDVIWRWGGVKNEFQFLGDTLKFSFQHAIRRLANGNYILFDNGDTHNPPFSRAVEYQLDQNAKTATLVWSYRPSPDLYASFLGFTQRLENGNTLVTFGALGILHEVSPSGELQWSLAGPSGSFIYRAYRIRSLYDPRLVDESATP